MDEVRQYDANMKKMYEYGADSFLTLRNGVGKKGDGETSYFHVLRCYIPFLAEDTFEKFKCGIGMWTMQGNHHSVMQLIILTFQSSTSNWILSLLLYSIVLRRVREKKL